jgi:hypothetical protein
MQALQVNVWLRLDVLLGVIRAVIALVQEVEVPGWGPAKKQVVLDLIAALYDANPAWQGVTKESILSLASAAIDLVVAFFHLIGRFRRSAPSLSPAPPPEAPLETERQEP